MYFRFISRVMVSAIVVAGVITGSSQPALASCAEIPDLETAYADAEVVFIGVVTDISNNDRTVTMQVEDIWKGPSLPDTVVVNGGPADSSTFTSVDRTFESGTYIVFPVNSSPPFADNACTLTQRTSAALDVIDPTSDGSPEAVVTDDALTTTSANVETIEDVESAEGPETEPVVGEPVLVSEGSSPTPIIVSVVIIAGIFIAVVIWRRRSARET